MLGGRFWEWDFPRGVLFQVVRGCLGSGENLLGDNIIVPIAWGGGFQGLFLLGDVNFDSFFALGFAWGGFA